LYEPPWQGHQDLVISLDPGDQTGWCMARILPNELRVLAMGTGTPSVSLQILRDASPRVAVLIVEEPARVGTAETMVLFGRFLEVVALHQEAGHLTVKVVRPTEWKQYPKRIRQTAEELLTRNSGELAHATRHERDALAIMAWWYIREGKEMLNVER
jgi:hypothetical protein